MSPVTDEHIDERLLRLGASLPALIRTGRAVEPTQRRPPTPWVRVGVGVAAVVIIGATAVSLAVSRPSAPTGGAGRSVTPWPSRQTVIDDLTAARGYVWMPSGTADRVRTTDPGGAVIEVWAPKGDRAAVEVTEHGDVPDRDIAELVLDVVGPGDTAWLDTTYPSLAVRPGGTGMTLLEHLPGGIAILDHEVADGASTWTLSLYPDGVVDIGQVEASPWVSPTPSPDAAAHVACDAVKRRVPLAVLRSGSATVAGAYTVDARQLTAYLADNAPNVHPLGSSGPGTATTVVMCLIDGDFEVRTPGPPGHDNTARRILVVVRDGEPGLWATTRDASSLPTIDELSAMSPSPTDGP